MNKHRPDGYPQIHTYVQVNTSGEESKSGISPDSEELLETVNTITKECPKLKFQGFMTIGAIARSQAAKEGEGTAEEEALEVDNDTEFLSHTLYFPKGNDEEVAKAEREYEVIDPRKRGAQAREEERERKKRIRPRDGGRGYRR